jgi:hypothetical protein
MSKFLETGREILEQNVVGGEWRKTALLDIQICYEAIAIRIAQY